MAEGKSQGFGTAPVFFTAIATILGAILFLRFGWAVGSLGFWGVIFIILIGHLVTIPTALSLSEIATNQKVEGGGEYFIISRSFGLNIGGTIGLALYMSQAISVAFYVIAFTEAFQPFFNWFSSTYGWELPRQAISLPTMTLLSILILKKGADMGVKALYFVVAILFVSLALFFLGTTDYSATSNFSFLNFDFRNMDNFFVVFAIIFPAFTGMTAGVGLSGDLKNPQKSIPWGTILATVSGMIIYFFISWKFVVSASPADLMGDQLIMRQIAIGGAFVIPIGLAASTISSALGSVMVAPRTLQALAGDKSLPFNIGNSFLSKGKGKNNEPFNASIVTIIIAFVFVAVGDVNAVGKIISMFFMITYGSLNLISFLYHYGADPSYRPSFRTASLFSLLGFVMSVWLMFKMDFLYTIIALIAMTLMYMLISRTHKHRSGLESIFQGAVYQLSMKLKLFVQRSHKAKGANSWRPAAVCVSSDSFQREKAFDLLSWISYKYGYGTYIHLIKGFFDKETYRKANVIKDDLLKRTDSKKHNVFVDTMISPSYTSAIAQIVQLPGISGMENNMVIFEYFKEDTNGLKQILENYPIVRDARHDVCILRSTSNEINYKNGIDIWVHHRDVDNVNLMILLAYVILAHPDWRKAKVKVYFISGVKEIEVSKTQLLDLIKQGRIPMSEKNVEEVVVPEKGGAYSIINEKSKDAGLTIIGFNEESFENNQERLFTSFEGLSDVLFVNSYRKKIIK
jgi:amino acid transporter